MGIFDFFKRKKNNTLEEVKVINEEDEYTLKIRNRVINKIDDVINDVELYCSAKPDTSDSDYDEMRIRKNGHDQLCIDVYKEGIYVKENVSIDYAVEAMTSFTTTGEVIDFCDYRNRGYVIDVAAYKELTELLVNDDQIKAELFDCFDNPLSHLANATEFLDDYMTDFDEIEDIEFFVWLYFIYMLEKEDDKLASFDYAEDPVEIAWLIDSVIPEDEKRLVIEEDDITNYVDESLKKLNQKWKQFNYEIVELYVDNDAYNLIILDDDKVKEVDRLLKFNNQKLFKYR